MHSWVTRRRKNIPTHIYYTFSERAFFMGFSCRTRVRRMRNLIASMRICAGARSSNARAIGGMLAPRPHALDMLSAHHLLPRRVLALDDRHQKLKQTDSEKDPRPRAHLRKGEAYLNYADVQWARDGRQV